MLWRGRESAQAPFLIELFLTVAAVDATLICLIYCAEFGCHKCKFVIQVWCSGLPVQIAGRLWRSNTDCSSKSNQQNVSSVPCCTPRKIWAFPLKVTCKCSTQHPKLLRIRWESEFSLAIILLTNVIILVSRADNSSIWLSVFWSPPPSKTTCNRNQNTFSYTFLMGFNISSSKTQKTLHFLCSSHVKVANFYQSI